MLSPEKIIRQKGTRVQFNIKKLKDPKVAGTCEAMIGRRFPPLTFCGNSDRDIDGMISTFAKAITETAREILGKHHQIKKPWVTTEIPDLCDKRRELKKE